MYLQNKLPIWLPAISILVFGGPAANAASTTAPTGVNAGFFSLQTDLTSILQGDGGAAIIVAGVLIGAAMLAFSARWTYIVSVLGVAVVLGYGFPVISSMAGVTADVDMISSLDLEPLPNTSFGALIQIGDGSTLPM